MTGFVGRWIVACKTPIILMDGLWDLQEKKGTYTSSFTAQGQTVPVTDIEIDGDDLIGSSFFMMGSARIVTVIKASLNHASDTVSGKFISEVGPMEFIGKREELLG